MEDFGLKKSKLGPSAHERVDDATLVWWLSKLMTPHKKPLGIFLPVISDSLSRFRGIQTSFGVAQYFGRTLPTLSKVKWTPNR